ncbi:MAG: tRNA-dependent cyclodipeptide synthase [Coxiellaceae bacterium]|nr:tRNA-dependent cyclodipeptide synthase [Coxiellaceae bacterium]
MNIAVESFKLKAKLGGLAKLGNKDIFTAKVIFPISVANPSQEAKKLQATLLMITKRFKQCDILIADTLQRYNYLNNMSEKDAYTKSKQMGRDWLSRNQAYLDDFPALKRIIRWDSCLQTNSFDNAQHRIKSLFNNDHATKQDFLCDTEVFLKRHSMSNNNAIMQTNCLQYLFEEAAVAISYFIEHGYEYILYPGSPPLSIIKCRDLIVKNSYPDLIHTLKVYFVKTYIFTH